MEESSCSHGYQSFIDVVGCRRRRPVPTPMIPRQACLGFLVSNIAPPASEQLSAEESSRLMAQMEIALDGLEAGLGG